MNLYNELYNAWKNETTQDEIQTLANDFYIRLSNYTRKLTKESLKADQRTTRGLLIKKEEEYVKKIVSELISSRYEKIEKELSSTKLVIDLKNLTDEEKKISEISTSRKEAYLSFLDQIIFKDTEKNKKETRKQEKMIVRIIKDATETKKYKNSHYGPLKSEDVVSLPKSIATKMIADGSAEEIQVDQ